MPSVSKGSSRNTSTRSLASAPRVGAAETFSLRIALDPGTGRSTFYIDGEVLSGSYAMNTPTSGSASLEFDYEDGLVQDGPVKFYGAGGLKLNLTYDTVKRELSGTMVDKSVTKWSLDGYEAVCSSTSTITGTEVKN